MPNGSPTDELLRRLLAAVAADATGEDVDQLIANARAEAEAEVKALVKASYKASLLRAATEQLEHPKDHETRPPSPRTRGEGGGEGQGARDVENTLVSAGDARRNDSGRGDFEFERESNSARRSPHSPALSPEYREEGVAARENGAESHDEGIHDDALHTAGCYVYAITPAAPQPWTQRERGVDPRCPLEVVAHEDLQAIVSPVSLEEFGQAALGERVNDPRWVEDKVRAHDHVVRSAMSAGAVIPCRFCTVVRSADDVRMLLSHHHDSIAAALATLRGKQEWGVKVFADVGTVTRQVAAHAEPSSADATTSGKSYLRRKQRADTTRSDADRLARAHADEIHAALVAAAADAAVLPRRPRTGNGQAPDPVLNAAYLVAENDVQRFHERVTELAERFRPLGITLDVTGPWPPYNFVRLDLSLQAVA